MVALLLWGSLCLRLTRFSGLGSSQGCSEQLSFLRERHCVSALDLKPKNKQRLLWLYLFIIMLALSSILLFLPVLHTAQMAGWYPCYVVFWSQCNSDHFWFWSWTIKTSKSQFLSIWAFQTIYSGLLGMKLVLWCCWIVLFPIFSLLLI